MTSDLLETIQYENIHETLKQGVACHTLMATTGQWNKPTLDFRTVFPFDNRELLQS
jgi:hypothetical protein